MYFVVGAFGIPKDAPPTLSARKGPFFTDSQTSKASEVSELGRGSNASIKSPFVRIARPYDLRHGAASLWLHERNYVQVAMWLGHNPAMTHATYAHVIEDLDPDQRLDAIEMILRARADVGSIARTSAHEVPTPEPRTSKNPEPESGLEPLTPCLQAHAGCVVECRGAGDLAPDGEIALDPGSRCVVEWCGACLHFCLHSEPHDRVERRDLAAPCWRACGGLSAPALHAHAAEPARTCAAVNYLLLLHGQDHRARSRSD
jgi:hypothetical protein